MTQRKTRRWRSGHQPSALIPRSRARLSIEPLEARNLLSCGPTGKVLEDFSGGNLSAYDTIIRYIPSSSVQAGVGCDGGNGLVQSDTTGDDWIIRNDGGAIVSQGDTVSAWVYLSGAGNGRTYFGFGAVDPAVTIPSCDQPGHPQCQPLTSGRTLSLVLAPNTRQFMLEENRGFKFTSPNFSMLGSVPQSYTMDQWYRVEVSWAPGGAITATLFDQDGTTPLNTVTGQQTNQFPTTSGSIAFRGFNGPYAWADIENVSAGAAPTGPFHPLRPQLILHNNQNRAAGPALPLPFEYTNYDGGTRDIVLQNLDSLAQFANCTGFTCDKDGAFNGIIGLTARNVSFNNTDFEEAWGPSLFGHFSNDTPQSTPNLWLGLYRQDVPNGESVRIGESGIKAFWSSVDRDYQFIFPHRTDTYSTGNNSERRSWGTTEELNPVTGERTAYAGMGGFLTNEGYWQRDTFRTFTSPYENLLQAPTEEIDPNLHPGAKYYLVGNIFVLGDADVTNNSRWTEYTVTRSDVAPHFRFQATGRTQLDICTMPGLALPIGRCVTGAAPSPSQGPIAITASVAALLPGNATSTRATVPISTEVTTLPALGQVDQAFASMGAQSQEVGQTGAMADVQPLAGAHGTQAAVDGVFAASLDHDLFAL